MQDDEIEVNIVMIAKPECLKCRHLCQLNKTEYPCNQEKYCPAHGYKIALGLDMHHASDKIADAMAKNHTKRLGKYMRKLSTYDTAIQNQVMALAKQKVNSL